MLCPGINLPAGSTNRFVLSGPVTGSPSNLQFSQSFNASGTGFVGTFVYAFTGVLSGGVVTGTLTPTFNQQGSGILVTGTTTMPVMLR